MLRATTQVTTTVATDTGRTARQAPSVAGQVVECAAEDTLFLEDGVRSPSPSPSPRHHRRRVSWPFAPGSGQGRWTEYLSCSEEVSSPRCQTVRLQWESKGISGRAYQNDGNPTLYRKKKLAARRRLSKSLGVRAAIEKGWWPYLPSCWIVLNEIDILKVLPKESYKRLLASMYTALVPTAGAIEAEEAASWDYGEDTIRQPADLTRIGITREMFVDALFALADNVRRRSVAFSGGCRSTVARRYV